jgi:putative membrane protein
MDTFIYIIYALIGTLIGGLMSVLPGMHALNMIGIGLFIYIAFPIDALALAMVSMGLMVGYIIVGIIQMTYMGVPDDSTRYFAFPNQKYLMTGRGHEAVIMTAMGALGSALLLLAIAPISSSVFPVFRRLTTPHFHWILIGVVAYLLQSDWPKDWGSRAKTRFGRLKDGWASLSAGLFVFFISMMMGFILLNISVLSPQRAFQNLMPVVCGLFAVSYLLMNLISRANIPPQSLNNTAFIGKKDLVRGTTAGFFGGMFAAYEPIITAGPGMKLAGHATSTSGDTQFMVSGGAGRYAYYIGSFFLFWVPMLHLARKALGLITSISYSPTTDSEFWLMMAAIAISTIFAFVLLFFLSRFIAARVSRMNLFRLSMTILSLMLGVIWGFAASTGYDPVVLLGTILVAAAIWFAIFNVMLRVINWSKGRHYITILAMIGLILGFILIQNFIVGYAGLVEGLRAMTILIISTGIGLMPLTFRTMWTFSLLGYFFPVLLSMAGLSAGIVVALGVY